MNKISIKESVLMACIIEAIQASLFDDGVSPEQEELYNKKKIARQNAAKKAAQTRSVNKQNKEKAINRAHVIARGTGEDLFGNKVSDDERKEAENYLQQELRIVPIFVYNKSIN